MSMQKISIDRELNSTSATIIWNMVSTPEGMTRWLADSVTQNGDSLTFTWGSPYDHHEKRTATILQKKKNSSIRFARDDEDGMDTFVEIKIDRSPLTGEFMLHITDFTSPEDRDWLFDTWAHNFRRLRRSCGI